MPWHLQPVQPVQPVRRRKAISEPNVCPSVLCQETTILGCCGFARLLRIVKAPPPWSAPTRPPFGTLSRNHHFGVPQRNTHQGTTTLGRLLICLPSQCRPSHRLNRSRHRHLNLDPKSCYPGLAHRLSFSLNNCSDCLRLIIDCLVVKCCIRISPVLACYRLFWIENGLLLVDPRFFIALLWLSFFYSTGGSFSRGGRSVSTWYYGNVRQ